MSHSSGALVGPAIAGVLIAKFGLASTYLIDGATFVVALLFLTGMRAVPPSVDAGPAGWRSVMEGVRFLKGRRVLQTTFTIDLNAMKKNALNVKKPRKKKQIQINQPILRQLRPVHQQHQHCPRRYRKNRKKS